MTTHRAPLTTPLRLAGRWAPRALSVRLPWRCHQVGLALVGLLLPTGATALDLAVSAVGADVSRTLLGDGTGVIVGVVDSGVDELHPALSGLDSLGRARMVAEGSFVPGETSTGDDVHGHGTWVTSAILSRDVTRTGPAPDARFVNARVLTNSGSFSTDVQVVNGVGFALEQNVDLLNLSLNFYSPNSDGNQRLDRMLDWAAYERGVLATVSAGNIGSGSGTSQVRSPASAYNVLAVGRTTNRPSYDRVHSDSATATTADGRVKPDLVAPGTSMTLANDDWEGAASDWDSGLGGTSFAAPLVAGVLAQQIEFGRANNLSTSPMVLKATLLNSSDKSVLDKSNQPWAPRQASIAGGLFSTTSPLDPDSGAGQLDATRLFQQYAAGHFDAGSVPVIGWDLGEIAGVSSVVYDIAQPLLPGSTFTATLNWLRHVTRTDSDNDGRIDSGDTYTVTEALDDLNLTLLLDGLPLARSLSSIDNVEHFSVPITRDGLYSLRVDRLAVTNSGAGETYALAWWGTAIPEPTSALFVLCTTLLTLPRTRR